MTRRRLSSDGRHTASMNCTIDQYPSEDRQLCCDRCPPGTYKKTDCDGTRKTECVRCPDKSFTALDNHLPHCHKCQICTGSHKVVRECSSVQDRVCGCQDGHYCSDEKCELCVVASVCEPGEGVKVKAIGTKDTICEECKAGTFSDKRDFSSACVPHTRCELFGGDMKIAGTKTNDTVCGRHETGCPWMLPAGLWSGLALTFIVFILFVIFCWWRKSRSYNTARPGVNPEAPPTVILQEPKFLQDHVFLPFPSMEVKNFCQETCKVDGCNLPLIISADNKMNGVTQDSEDVLKPTTPLKPSVSLVESSCGNGNTQNSGDFQRMFSEPQEDEWCDT